MDVLIKLFWAVSPGLIVGIFMAAWNRRQAKTTDRDKEQQSDKLETDLMRIDLEVASAQLAYAVAMAVKRGTPNGEMEEAIERYETAMEKFRKFERKQVAKSTLDERW